ncbi:hypothetical protein [Dorea formicigenerans]|nr:hypothetical protein [Dorea formicigenerans]
MNTEKNEVAAITGTTESGFRYTLPPDALDDYELLENLWTTGRTQSQDG